MYMSTQNQTIAGSLNVEESFGVWSSQDFDTIDQYFRIQFYMNNQTWDETTKVATSTETYFNATKCSTFYAEEMETDASLNNEFSGNWICPDIDTITVYQNPYLYKYGDGINLIMVVNNCE